MGIARYLSKLAGVLSTDGVVPPSKGGTGVTSPGVSGNVLVSDGTSWTSQNIPLGATGPTGPGGLGFTIAKTYSSVAALTADTSPTGIQAGQFALIDTGDANNAENSRLYVWTGSAYTYTSDLSGAQGIVGPTGPAGTNGIIGVDGATGPTGPAGALVAKMSHTFGVQDRSQTPHLHGLVLLAHLQVHLVSNEAASRVAFKR